MADATIKGILKNVHREKPMDVINYVYDLEQRTDIRICCFLILPLLHSVSADSSTDHFRGPSRPENGALTLLNTPTSTTFD